MEYVQSAFNVFPPPILSSSVGGRGGGQSLLRDEFVVRPIHQMVHLCDFVAVPQIEVSLRPRQLRVVGVAVDFAPVADR